MNKISFIFFILDELGNRVNTATQSVAFDYSQFLKTIILSIPKMKLTVGEANLIIVKLKKLQKDVYTIKGDFAGGVIDALGAKYKIE